MYMSTYFHILNSLMKIDFMTKSWTIVLILSYSFFNDRYIGIFFIRKLSKSEQKNNPGTENCTYISHFYEHFV